MVLFDDAKELWNHHEYGKVIHGCKYGLSAMIMVDNSNSISFLLEQNFVSMKMHKLLFCKIKPKQY